MEFIRLNYWKFFCIFCVCFFVWGIIGFFIYLTMKNNMAGGDLVESIHYLLIFIISMSLVWFLAFFLGGIYNFYRARKLISFIVSLGIFDNDTYFKEYFYKRAWFNFTKECVYGDIQGYPVMLYIFQRISKYATTKINIEVFIIKFNRNSSELVSFPLEWLNKSANDQRQDIFNFVSEIKGKGYQKGDVKKGIENK